MAVRVGINGFGRIGRNVFRACWGEAGPAFVAASYLADVDWAWVFKILEAFVALLRALAED